MTRQCNIMYVNVCVCVYVGEPHGPGWSACGRLISNTARLASCVFQPFLILSLSSLRARPIGRRVKRFWDCSQNKKKNISKHGVHFTTYKLHFMNTCTETPFWNTTVRVQQYRGRFLYVQLYNVLSGRKKNRRNKYHQ